MIEPSEWPSLAKPDPEWEQVVQNEFYGHTPDLGEFDNIKDLRVYLIRAKEAAAAAMGSTPDGLVEEDIQIPMRDGTSILARVHKPKNPPADGSPLYIMFHGGGFCLGGIENEILSSRLLAQKLGVTVVNVDYRLAPEHPFPTAPHDCWDATKWAAANASRLGADPSRGFLVGGTSAGGNLSAVVAYLARDEGLQPPITGGHYMIPALCDHSVIPDRYKALCTSYEQNKDAAILSRRAMTLFMENYCPNPADRANPLMSPMLFPTGHSKLPPAYFQVTGSDPLRDEGLLFEKILREEEGIATKIDIYPGQPHGFHSLSPGQKASQKWNDDFIKGAAWLLAQHTHA